MTTFTMNGFAQKLGFKRASDPRFRTLLKQWAIEGAVKVYQGGYLGHSAAHPKKTLLTKSIEYFQEAALKAPPFRISLRDGRRTQLAELGFRVKYAARKSSHRCSVCQSRVRPETDYALASYFLTVKLCGGCAEGLCEGEFTVNPEIKIIEKGKVETNE